MCELKMIRDLKKMNELAERLNSLMKTALEGQVQSKKVAQLYASIAIDESLHILEAFLFIICEAHAV